MFTKYFKNKSSALEQTPEVFGKRIKFTTRLLIVLIVTAIFFFVVYEAASYSY